MLDSSIEEAIEGENDQTKSLTLANEAFAISLRSIPIPFVHEKNEMNRKDTKAKQKESNSGFNLSLLKNPIFILFCISNFLMSIGFYPPFVYIVDQGIFLKIDPYKADCIFIFFSPF